MTGVFGAKGHNGRADLSRLVAVRALAGLGTCGVRVEPARDAGLERDFSSIAEVRNQRHSLIG
jgi:hypothetical protein